jgi:type II secretory ATPase GspE/PulE/Tfp pilus assembly ATPase PilB-like protein
MSSPLTTNLLDMDQVKIDPKWALRIPGNLATRRKLLPFTKQGEDVLVACVDKEDLQGLKAVERYVAAPVIPHAAEPESLQRAINRIFLDLNQTGQNQAVPTRTAFANSPTNISSDGDSIVALGDEIFHAAMIRQATDIHIEPGTQIVRVHLRVDGLLEEYREIPKEIHQPLISRLKVLAGMDIAERRAPQDGRFTLGTQKEQMTDVRAATIPTKNGERMTLRLLATNKHQLTLENLGMLPSEARVFESCISHPNGLVLLTGPTGCGKSTTLYAAIRQLIGHKALNVITIEDPVEYVIDGISQVEVDSADKVSFHKALRSGLRHDPDVLMIGEIRDEVTAEIAIKAALTGHLVFATLHTNSAASSLTRLINMNVQAFLVGAVSRLFMAQRLVRKLCQHCRQPVEMDERQAVAINRESLVGSKIFAAGGCKYCAGSGFVGRTGLFELLPFDRQLAKMASSGADESTLNQHMADEKIPLLLDDAITKLKLGVTSFSEIATVVNLF